MTNTTTRGKKTRHRKRGTNTNKDRAGRREIGNKLNYRRTARLTVKIIQLVF